MYERGAKYLTIFFCYWGIWSNRLEGVSMAAIHPTNRKKLYTKSILMKWEMKEEDELINVLINYLQILLLIGTKLQVIITKMALRIQERGEVVKGVPVVEPGDDLFWFNRPRLILYLINFVLFQNAFQVAFFAWTWVSTLLPS